MNMVCAFVLDKIGAVKKLPLKKNRLDREV